MTGWEVKKIGDCLTIRHGKNQRAVEAPNGEFPILGTGGQIGCANKYLYSKPSVLIGRKGTIDKPRYMDTPFWTVDTLFYSEMKSGTNAKFMYYIFKIIDWRKYNEASGVPSLSATSISNIKINIPTIDEQERIVRLLETWDIYIELLENKITLRRQVNKEITRKLLVGKLHTADDDKDRKETKLGNIAKVIMGQSPSSSNYNRNGNGIPLVQGNADMHSGRTITRVWTTEITREVPAGSLIMTVRAPVGEVAIADQKLCIGRGVCAIESDYASYLRIYLNWYRPQWSRYVQGSTFESINSSDIRDLTISIPSKASCAAIVKIVTHLENELVALYDVLSQLKIQRKFLQIKLTTGKIRVSESMSTKVE